MPRCVKHCFGEGVDSLSNRRARDRERECKGTEAGERGFAVFTWIVGRMDGAVRDERADAKK